MSYATYERYKDSGVDWLGKIPSDWDLIPNKHIFKLKNIKVGKKSSEYDLLSLTLKGVIKRDMENPEGKFPAEFDTYQEVKNGNFIFCMFDVQETPRTVGLSKFDGMITGAYTVFDVNENYNRDFLYYFYLNLDLDKRLKPLYRGLRNTIPKEWFLNFKTFVPSFKQQKTIANFLDDKTAQIDQAISLKQQQIEKLNEYKQIVIQNAVTKGLNPNVPMKDSGVEWIGDIPEHWDVKKLKYVLKSYNKKISSRNSDLRYLGMENIISKTGEINNESAEVEGLANHFKPNHILFGKLRPYLAKVYLADFEGICSTEFLVFEVLEPNNAKFLQILLLSNGFIQNIDSSTYGSKMPRANPDFINNQFIAIPPLDEQLQIINAIENKNQPIKQAIEKYQTQIDRLKEYKNILINQAVTGKLKI